MLKSQDFKGLDNIFICKIAFQILISLYYLSSHKIIHCDLKPENILLKSSDSYNIKVIDFGSSCFLNERMYSYIQSRFYRAPEIILGINYGLEIDMWSFGCILAELYTGIPIFPGEDETDQLFYMMEYLGVPSIELLKISKKRKFFFNDDFTPKKIQNSRGKIRIPNTKKIYKFLLNSDSKLINLIERCLIWEPEKRITPEEALHHPYILERYQKDIHEILYHTKTIERNISLYTKNNNNNFKTNNLSNENNQNINLNYINNNVCNNCTNQVGILDEKININININRINNCLLCNNSTELLHVEPYNEKIQNLPIDVKGKLIDNSKSNEIKENFNNTNLYLTNSQNEKKTNKIGLSIQNLNTNNYKIQPYANKNLNEKYIFNNNNSNNTFKNLISHTNNNVITTQKNDTKSNFKQNSKNGNYVTYNN